MCCRVPMHPRREYSPFLILAPFRLSDARGAPGGDLAPGLDIIFLSDRPRDLGGGEGRLTRLSHPSPNAPSKSFLTTIRHPQVRQ